MKKLPSVSLPRPWTLSLAAIAVVTSPARADDDVFFSDLPIVASVSRLPQRLSEAPASVTVIDEEMIRASGMRTVEDLLRLVPGFQVTSHNQDPAIVAYHGLNSGLGSDEYGPRVQVLVDGRSQYSPLFKSGVNWNLLPVALENIARIEVTRGSNTVSYGSNAFMGVINIITHDTTQTQGWLVSANHGNNSIRDDMLRWGGKVGQADVRFTAHQLEDDGFQQGFYSNVWTFAPDNRRSALFDLRVDFAPTSHDEVQLSASQAQDVSLYGRPGSPLGDPLRDFRQSSASLGLQWRHVVTADEEMKLRYAYTEDKASAQYLEGITFDTNRTSPSRVAYLQAFDPGGESRVHELEFEHRLAPLANTRLIWGAAAKSIALYSPAQFSTTDWKYRNSYRGFGNLEFRPEKSWLFNLGASLEYDTITGLMFDPRASASYHVTPHQTVRLVVSSAHRNPSLYETSGRVEKRDVNGTGLANITYLAQGVEPERIDTVEVGYLGEFKSLRASLDVRAFHERIPNGTLIVPLALPASDPDDHDRVGTRLLAQSVPTLAYAIYPYGRADGTINLQRVTISGYEYQAAWKPFETTRLLYNNAFVYIDAEISNYAVLAEDTNNGPKIIRQTAESAPVHSQSAMLIQQLPFDIQASVMYFRATPMRWRRNGDPIQASERFDWRLAKGFTLGSTRGELAYTVQMANASQEGRQPNRIADQLHWLSMRLAF